MEAAPAALGQLESSFYCMVRLPADAKTSHQHNGEGWKIEVKWKEFSAHFKHFPVSVDNLKRLQASVGCAHVSEFGKTCVERTYAPSRRRATQLSSPRSTSAACPEATMTSNSTTPARRACRTFALLNDAKPSVRVNRGCYICCDCEWPDPVHLTSVPPPLIDRSPRRIAIFQFSC
jgi:hypothetical protein